MEEIRNKNEITKRGREGNENKRRKEQKAEGN